MKQPLFTLSLALTLACGTDPHASAVPLRGAARAATSLLSPSAELASAAIDNGEKDLIESAKGLVSPSTQESQKKRIYSVAQVTWIRKKPAVKEGDFLGYVRTGSSVPLRSEERKHGAGCPGGFYQVEPRGYVCADRTVSETPRPLFREAAVATKGVQGPLPYGYALSNHAPMYNRIPTASEQRKHEFLLGKPGSHLKLPKTLRSHEELATSDSIAANSEVPTFLLNGSSPKQEPYDLVEQLLPLGTMVSYSRAFEANGRTWLLSSDHTIVPADRVRPFRPSKFRGVDLTDGTAELPIAWMRVTARPKYKKARASVKATGGVFPVRSWVGLTGAKIEAHGAVYLETRLREDEAPLYLKESDATVVEAETTLPLGAKEGQKWLQIRLSQGTLVAYQGLRPEYATLVAPGAGGVPVKGADAIKNSTTPLGVFSITFKDRAATMSPEKGKDRSFWIQDVPHTQYFNPPFALHASFWHERFGEYVSAGCLNLSPIDAEMLFSWTDPPVPAEWQGATGAGARENGPTTLVAVRR